MNKTIWNMSDSSSGSYNNGLLEFGVIVVADAILLTSIRNIQKNFELGEDIVDHEKFGW